MTRPDAIIIKTLCIHRKLLGSGDRSPGSHYGLINFGRSERLRRVVVNYAPLCFRWSVMKLVGGGAEQGAPRAAEANGGSELRLENANIEKTDGIDVCSL